MPVPTKELSAKRSIAAHSRWAFEPDRLAATAPGRRVAESRFETFIVEQLGFRPSEDELAKRVKNLKSAYFTELALRSAAARRAKAGKS